MHGLRGFFVILHSMKSISILIPTFNGVCTALVAALQRQAEALGTDYEVIVADDGSTDTATVGQNRAINGICNCRYVERPQNAGRAAIRNFLASEARHPWLVFIDSDMVVCRPDYIAQYASTPDDWTVVDGGICVGGSKEEWKGNLRYRYEKAEEHKHTTDVRRQHPYHDFHTANFMVRRDVMLSHPFDHRARYYGYEDVLFGKQMEQAGIAVHHIDNPMSFEVFEPNGDFIRKTEEGLRTLHQFRSELQGYSRLLSATAHMPQSPVRLWHRLFGSWERRQLTGSHPSLWLFKLYRLGYYATINK